MEAKGLTPTKDGATGTEEAMDPDVKFLVTRDDIADMVDEELSEIINEKDYNENCNYVGEYT